VLAARALADLALAAALGAEYRRRIRKRHARCEPMTSMATKINPIDPSTFDHMETKRRTQARCAVQTDGMVKDEAAITDAASPSQHDAGKPSSRGRCAVFCRLGPREILRPGCPRSSAAHPWPWAAGDRSAPV